MINFPMKKILITSCVLLIASFVQADYLYWMVNDTYGQAAGTSSEDPYAKLVVITESGNIELSRQSAESVYAAWDVSGAFSVDISSYSSDTYSFYVELWNGYRTDSSTYSSLVANGYVYQVGLGVPSNIASSGGFGSNATYAIPEPTSGLLFLLGGMLLGLKRRRQV